ncbi:hypothetical protein EON65_11350 [archaeon]|nr:MAG: hypothetical protein EON65_11350 [archaeon]
MTVLAQETIISKQSAEDTEAPDVDEEDEQHVEVYDHPLDDQRYFLHKVLLANQLAALESLHYILSNEKAMEESYLRCLLTYISQLLPLVYKLTQHVYEDIRTNTLVLLPDLVRVLCIYSSHHQLSQRLGDDSVHNMTVLLPPDSSDVYNVYDIIVSMLQIILENIRVYADQLDYCCTMCRVLKEMMYQASLDRSLG